MIEKIPYEELVNKYRSASELNKKYVKEIERLNKTSEIDIKYIKYLQKEIVRLNNKLKQIDNLVEEIDNAPLVVEDMFPEFYNKYYELKESDKE